MTVIWYTVIWRDVLLPKAYPVIWPSYIIIWDSMSYDGIWRHMTLYDSISQCMSEAGCPGHWHSQDSRCEHLRVRYPGDSPTSWTNYFLQKISEIPKHFETIWNHFETIWNHLKPFEKVYFFLKLTFCRSELAMTDWLYSSDPSKHGLGIFFWKEHAQRTFADVFIIKLAGAIALLLLCFKL
jgi:hypothetical protein